MNKLSFALGAAFTVCTLNIASAQTAGSGTGPANPAMGSEMKREQATEPADTSGTTAPGRKGMSKDGMHKEGMHKGGMQMKAMDGNKDGMVSKEEFMSFHEAMYDGMQKNKDGMVDMKEMRKMHPDVTK